ncbi:MAG: hypothetical protein Fur0020_10130 [Thermodesulfovibrionia bacterium]
MMDKMMKRRYERPIIRGLSPEYPDFADGSQCIEGAHLTRTCSSGIFASEPCSAGSVYDLNECWAGPGNLGGS